MNNKAFTLIELTAIIVVLSAIFLVSFPSLLNSAKKEDEKKYNSMVENLCIAGKSYIYANMDDYEGLSIVGNTYEIKIDKLVKYGNVDSDLINPKTDRNINNDSLVYTVLNDYSLDCKYKES